MGISWRHGPHQLAQKLISTTWPFRSLSATGLPSEELSWKLGASAPGAMSAASALAGSAAMPSPTRAAPINVTSRDVDLMFASVRCQACALEKYAQADGRLQIVGEPVDAEDVGAKDDVLHVDMKGQPVGG